MYVRDKRLGKYHNFPSKFFCLTVPKFFVGEHSIVSLISGIENFSASEVYVKNFDFLSIFFVSQCRKFSYGNPLVFHSFRLSKNVERREDEVSRFCVEVFVLL